MWLLVLPCSLLAQDSRGLRVMGHWDTTGLPLNGSEARYNEVWGFVVAGEEFAVIGSTMGSHIIHLKANNNLEEVAFIPGTAQGDYIVHRDYDVFEHYLYAVGDQEPATLQIIDISGLPETAELVYQEDSLFTRAHNFFIDQTTGRGYACGTPGISLQVLNLASNPTAPERLLAFNEVEYVHDCYVRNDTAFLNTGNPGLAVVDFADVTNPVFLATMDDYVEDGYNHSGWLDPSGDWYIFADETMESSMKICDVSDLSDIQITDLFDSGNSTFIAHNLYIKGNRIYVSHYFDGLQVFDWSNPSNVRRVAWYDTSTGEDICCRGAWGTYPYLPSGRIVVSDRQRGLFLFEEAREASTSPAIEVTPNPASETVEVNLMDFGFRWNVGVFRVFDAVGRLVVEGTLTNPDELAHWFEIDVTSFRPGLYTVQFEQGDQLATGRFVKR